MGKSSKRKAQGSVAQITDSPKKAKLEVTNKPDQESTKIKKQNGDFKSNTNVKSKGNKGKLSKQNEGKQKGTEATKTLQKKVKNTPKTKNITEDNQQEKSGKTNAKGEVQNVIPAEFAQNLNKRQKHAVSRKLRNLIKVRQARGEEVNKDDINILVKEIIEQTASNKADKSELDNDEKAISTNEVTVPKTKKESLTKK